MLEPTERAVEAVVQAETAARRFDPAARVRLRRDGAGVRLELCHAPEPGDEPVDCAGTILLVERGLDSVLDTGDHNLPMLIPREA
jgi:hypothetical protein